MDAYDIAADFGLLYDSVPLYANRADVGFYVAHATQTQGSILDIGCGTGRILLPIARAGAMVTGIESSRAMLTRCRRKLEIEPGEIRSRVTLHEGDARDFDLGSTFQLIIAPFRVLQHLVTIEDQLRCLHSVARHLAPGGQFIFDVFNPQFHLLTSARTEETNETPELPLPDGRTMRRAFRVARVRWIEQVSEVELIYYVAERQGAPAKRHVQAFDMRWYLRAELIHLLARAGLRATEILGNFDASPLVDGAPEQVVIAQSASATPPPRGAT